jgi:hypothetical protein
VLRTLDLCIQGELFSQVKHESETILLLDREITQLVIRIDRLRHHSNRQTLIRKLEELLIREALS